MHLCMFVRNLRLNKDIPFAKSFLWDFIISPCSVISNQAPFLFYTLSLVVVEQTDLSKSDE